MIESSKALAVKLTTQGEKAVKADHPWVFSKNIESIKGDPKTGDRTIIFDRKTNRFLGLGLYDTESPIRIKMLFPREKGNLDGLYFINKFQKSYEARKKLIVSSTNAFRWIFGENDGLPSLIVDVYDDIAVLKLYSGIWLPYLEDIILAIPEVINCQAIVLRLSRNVQENFPNIDFLKDGNVIWGHLERENIIFHENNVQFSANVIHGHKTGYFLDHRQNRIEIGKLCQNKSVLDVFSYAGGFSVHALVGGAKKVVSVDISGPALELARQNAKLNGNFPNHECRKGDAFKILENSIFNNEKYDIVVIDPPSFAKNKEEIKAAKKQYARIATLGSKLVGKKGILLLASCSSRINADEFFQINEEALSKSGRNFEILKKTFHDIDHPIRFAEGAYLKSAYYQFND